MQELTSLIDNLNNINNQILASVDDRALKVIRQNIITKINSECKSIRANTQNPDQFNDLIRKYVNTQQNYYQTEKDLLETQRLMQGLETYNYVSFRHKQVLKLEKDIQEINELFICMYALVDQQGNVIDKIEESVSNAKSDCLVAKEEFVEAVKHKKKWYKF